MAHIERKSGGYIITTYDSLKNLSRSSSIKLPIPGFIDGQLIVLKVNLPNNFSVSVQNEDEHLQEIIQFEKLGNKQTKVISSKIGWGRGSGWEKTYNIFEMEMNGLPKNY